jgi:hypothetical protein
MYYFHQLSIREAVALLALDVHQPLSAAHRSLVRAYVLLPTAHIGEKNQRRKVPATDPQ